MLTPDYLEYCADDIVELYSRLDESIIRDIARRIVKTGNITDTANWQIEKIQQGGYLYDDVIAEIARITGESDSRVKTLFENAGLKSMEFDNAIYKKAGFVIPKDVMSAAAYQVLRAGADKTSGNLRNLTMTTANTSQSAYINACTLAEMQIESGAFDYQTAIRNAVREAAKKGSVVSYPSGHIDRLDVAVRRAVLTGVSQTTGQVALQNAKDMGCDLMEITAHSGARPSHQVWQGQLVSLSGRTGYFSLSDIGYGEGSGFKGWNCRHDWFPYFEGISQRAYSDDDLKALDEETVTYNGKSYTEYAATQVQRAMEREIRSTRRELIGLDELIKGGDSGAKAEFENLSVKLKSQEAKLKDFCYKTDRKVDKFRVQVNGFDKSVSQKAVWTEKKAVAKSVKDFEVKPGKDIRTNANFDIINSQTYIDKFAGLGTQKAQEKISEISAAVIKRRNGTKIEEVFAVDSETGRVITSLKGKADFGVNMSEKFKKALKKQKENSIIIVHNHPLNYTFSVSDVQTASEYNSVKSVVAATHSGSVHIFSGKVNNMQQLERDYRIAYSKYINRGISDGDARIQAWIDSFGKVGVKYEVR